jgi:aspartate/methionine/tyrosine aminotransferase
LGHRRPRSYRIDSKSLRLSHRGRGGPLQEAGVTALSLPDTYYQKLAGAYGQRRDWILEILRRADLDCYAPGSANYIMSCISNSGFSDDLSFVRHLLEKIGVAAVPGSSFFAKEKTGGAGLIRFCFCKKYETLKAAGDRLGLLAKPPAA